MNIRKYEVLRRISDLGVVGIIRTPDIEQGVAPGNLDDWFQAGAFAVGLGSALLKPAGTEGDFQAISETPERIVTRIAQIRAHL